jgi:hypothetical protein
MAEIAIRREGDSLLAPAAVLTAILAASAAAWLVLAARMSGMGGGPGGDPGPLGWFTVSWAVMTAAMMLPAAAPAVFRAVRVAQSKRVAALPVLAGYGAVWMVAGLAGYAVVVAVRSAHPGALAWSAEGRYLAGGVVAAAGLYQLSRTKRHWLGRCTTPALKLRRSGAKGALLAGLEHGGCCVACCWNLMVALYALGMMNILWMVLLTILIAAERCLPRRALAVAGAAALLLLLGASIAVAPELTTPGAGMKMGDRMQMGKTTEMKEKSKSTMDAAPGRSVRRWPPAVTSQHP